MPSNGPSLAFGSRSRNTSYLDGTTPVIHSGHLSKMAYNLVIIALTDWLQGADIVLWVTTDELAQLVILEPDSALSEMDFNAAAATIDPLIENDSLKGIIISTEKFPSWESFGALVGHLRFVRDHHELVNRVAIVTDSRLGDLVEKLAGHFISARIRHFPYGEIESAKSWIGSD